MKKTFTLLTLLIFSFFPNKDMNAQVSLLLDYDGMDYGYFLNSTDTSWRYNALLWDLNKNLPNDSSYTLRFGSVFFDTIINYDYTNNVVTNTYALSSSTIRLDSFKIYYNHLRTSTATSDTIYFYVFNTSQYTITGTGANAVFSAPWVWKDSIVISGTNSANSLGTNLGNGLFLLTRSPNITLPPGQSFGIYVEFRGAIQNRLQLVAGYRNECSDACVAEPAFAPDNSIYYVNLLQGGNFSGINSVSFDCDANSVLTPGGCEHFYIQNFWVLSYITRTASVLTTPAVTTLPATNIAQGTATLNGTVNPNGGTASAIFEWGLTIAYGDSVPPTPITITGSNVTSVAANLTGLAANTTYHFRLKATKNGTVTYGNDMTFTTSPAGNVCIADPTQAFGMRPNSDSVPCVIQGQAFIQTFTYVVPTNVNGVPVLSVNVDSIGNLPAGLGYAFYINPVNTGGRSCFLVSGTTNAACGQYNIALYVTVVTQAGPFYGELSALATQFGIPDFEMIRLRVISSGGTCPEVDTTQTLPFVADITCGLPVSVSVTGTNINCFGQSTGSATATPIGGTPPYTYTWNVSGSTSIVSNLTAGTYYVTVTDANGDTATDSVTITQPASAVTVSTSTTQSSCSQNTGSATATPSGGTAGYFYAWSNNSIAATISNLAPQSYYVTVTDAVGCTASASAVITTPVNFSLSTTPVHVVCYGDSTGSAVVNITGGTGPFTYSWNSGATAANATGLAAGIYIVTVADAGGCAATASVTISQPANPLMASATSTPSTCGGATGSVTVTAINNVGAPVYIWSTGATTATVNNLASGIYTVTVTAGTCTATASTVVNNSNGPAISLLKTDPTCFNSSNGSITSVVTGGVTPYTFAWSNQATTANISNLPAGTYSLVVTDSTGCQATELITLTQPAALIPNGTVTNVACNGGQTGSVSLAVTGGTGPYTYTWSNAGTSLSIINLTSGNYSVTVLDANQCSITAVYTVTQPTPLIVTTSSTTSSGTNGTATVAVSGGSTPYNYVWSTVPAQNTVTATGLAPGTYFVTVLDANGCSATASVGVIFVGIDETKWVMSNFSLYPNPANDNVKVTISLDGTHNVQLSIADLSGKVVYTSEEKIDRTLNQQINTADFSGGVYVMEAKIGKEVVRRRFVVSR